MDAIPKELLEVFVLFLEVHVSVLGSYFSTTLRCLPLYPPMAYITPLTTHTPNAALAVGMGLRISQLSSFGSYTSTVCK